MTSYLKAHYATKYKQLENPTISKELYVANKLAEHRMEETIKIKELFNKNTSDILSYIISHIDYIFEVIMKENKNKSEYTNVIDHINSLFGESYDVNIVNEQLAKYGILTSSSIYKLEVIAFLIVYSVLTFLILYFLGPFSVISGLFILLGLCIPSCMITIIISNCFIGKPKK